MSKIKFTALGLAGFTVANLGLSTYAITGDVKLNVNVDPAIALTIQSSSDGSTIYAESDPAGQVVNNYTGEGLTPFGTSSAKTNMLPNTADESMWSKVTVYTNNTEGYKLTVSDTDDDTSLTTGTYTIPTGTTIAAGTSAWAFKGGKFADYTAMSPISSALTIAESTTKSAVDGDTTEIHYGVSTSADQATGTYSDTIVYTVTGEEIIVEEDFYTIIDMQDMTPSVCMNTTTPLATATLIDRTGEHKNDSNYVPAATLTDARDGKTYEVRKLADGECWMIQNLALNLSTEVALTPADSDVSEDWYPSHTSSTTADLGQTWLYSNENPSSYDTGSRETGNLYNWAAAVAKNDVASYSSENVYVGSSVCPKGWELPRAEQGADKSFSMLGSAYGLPQHLSYDSGLYLPVIESEILNFNRTGYVLFGFMTAQNSDGNFWSGTSVGGSVAGAFYYNSVNRYYPNHSMNRYNGFPVRCLAK